VSLAVAARGFVPCHVDQFVVRVCLRGLALLVRCAFSFVAVLRTVLRELTAALAASILFALRERLTAMFAAFPIPPRLRFYFLFRRETWIRGLMALFIFSFQVLVAIVALNSLTVICARLRDSDCVCPVPGLELSAPPRWVVSLAVLLDDPIRLPSVGALADSHSVAEPHVLHLFLVVSADGVDHHTALPAGIALALVAFFLDSLRTDSQRSFPRSPLHSAST
jgi:hypothetical protein